MTNASTLKVLLVDDEEPARARLRQMIAGLGGVEIVGEAEDGEQAIEAITASSPDVVFLDIQMPGCSGIEVAASLRAPRPRIIFCTAFDQYAVDAFELHAVDYLLKPVSLARLAGAVERARRASSDSIEGAIDRAGRTAGAFPTRFLAKRGTRYHVIPQRDVVYFATEEGVTKVKTRELAYWMQPTLGELEERLDPKRFFRISRSAIVSLDWVSEVHPLSGGQGELKLKDESRLEVSRRRLGDLMERLASG